MWFHKALFAVHKGAAVLTPEVLVCGAVVALTVGLCKYISNKNKRTLRQQQEDGDINSSEVEDHLHLGSVGRYKE